MHLDLLNVVSKLPHNCAVLLLKFNRFFTTFGRFNWQWGTTSEGFGV